MKKCDSIFGHKFKARYNNEEILNPFSVWLGAVKFNMAFAVEVESLVERCKTNKQTYICDVCVRCGEKT